MERFIDLIKRYPLWILGGVVALVLIFWYAGSGGDNSQPVIVSTGPSDMTVAQNAETERVRLALQAQGAAGVVSTELARIQADAYTQFLGTSRDIAEIEGNTQTSLASIITGATTSQTQIYADTTRELAEIDKSKAIDLTNIGAALEKDKIKAASDAAYQANYAAITINAANNYHELIKMDKQISFSGNAFIYNSPENMASVWNVPLPPVTNVYNSSNTPQIDAR